MSRAAFCLASSTTQAQTIVQHLRDSGFHDRDISVLYPDRSGAQELTHDNSTKAPEGAAAGAGTGGVVGATVGWLVGIGSLAIPGIGPFIAAGPILAALSGAAVGATVGGITGGLIGMGIPEYEAKLYEGKLRDGKVLISVHTDDGKQLDRAKKTFETMGAEDIGVSSEHSAKAS